MSYQAKDPTPTKISAVCLQLKNCSYRTKVIFAENTHYTFMTLYQKLRLPTFSRKNPTPFITLPCIAIPAPCKGPVASL